MKRVHSFGLVMALIAWACSYAAAQQYAVVDLGKVATSSTAHALNNAGQIAGAIGGAHGDNITAFFWHGNNAKKIGRPQHSDYSEAFGLNNSGEVVGSANLVVGMRGFFWTNGNAINELAPLAGDSSSAAYAVNDSGVVVGFSSGPKGMAAVRWQGGTPQAIVPPSLSTTSQATAINAIGSVAGFYGEAESKRGFLMDSTGLQTLAPLAGDQSSQALAINDGDAVAGISVAANGLTHAVVWIQGSATNLGLLPGGDHSQSYGINHAGQVVGSSGSIDGLHGFIWTAAGGMQDLNSLVPAGSNLLISAAVAINDAGQILAIGSNMPMPNPDRNIGLDRENHSGITRVFLLTPQTQTLTAQSRTRKSCTASRCTPVLSAYAFH